MLNFHVIKDPVHGSMQFTSQEDNWIKPFLDSVHFQRLRHIKQLGLADWIFPGAEHTRFNHCIGCCYVGSQICNKLGLDAEDKQLVMIACLVHDIGHGPFSHAFEHLFYNKSVHHEAWTPMFLADYATDEFLQKYNERNPDFPLDRKKLNEIEKLIMGKSDNRLLGDIVSSQLDADRLDYLLRDSHFCGVTYGVYDFRWLLHCLMAIEKEGETRLGISAKGIGVTEQYLMARRLMVKNVYHHGKKHGGEFLLQEFLKQLAIAVEDETHFDDLSVHSLVKFLRQVNKFNAAASETQELNILINQFIKENFDLYKKLYDYDIFSIIRRLAYKELDHVVVRLAKRLYARQLPRVIYLPERSDGQAERIVNEFKAKHRGEFEEWQITVIQLPHLSYEIHHDPILIQNSYGKITYLHDDSLMIGAISDRHETLSLVSIDSALIDSPIVAELQHVLHNL